MEFFPDRTHVWLWNREYEGYLFADEYGEDISTSNIRGELHGAWAVHRLVRDGTDYVLFQSSSYGRYLALIGDDWAYGPRQCTYDSPENESVLFQAVRADADPAEDGSIDIIISNFTFGEWNETGNPMMPMRWVVEAIPPRLLPPELPLPPDPTTPPPVPIDGPIRLGLQGSQVQVQVPPPQVELRWTIHYVRADDQGRFIIPLQWRMLHFDGQSVFNLRRDLAAELGEANNVLGITLCVWAGSSGRLTPLVIDLPPDERTMNIVVLTTGSPAAQALVYPNV